MTHEQAAYRHHPLDAEAPTVADQAAVCICGHTEQQHFEDACLVCDCGDFLPPAAAREVIARYQEAAKRKPTDRAAVLREAADVAESLRQFDPATGAPKSAQVSENVGVLRVAEELRRLAAEAQQPDVPRCPACGHTVCDGDGPCGARSGDDFCTCPGPGAEAQQQPTDEDVVKAHRLALSFALGLGTGAPWDAIRDRAAELHGAEAQQQPHTETRVYDHRAWEAYHRDAGCGCTDPNPVNCAIPHGTGAWLCVCHRLSGPPIKESDPPGTFLTAEQGAVRKHYRHPNRCLSVRGAFRCELGVDHGGDHRLKRTVWRDAPAAEQQPAAADTGEETDAIRLDEDGRDVETGHLPGCASQSYPDPGICYCDEA